MAKTALKKTISDYQDGVCDLSGEVLPEKTELYDTDRKKPKAQGGTYAEKENVRTVTPIAHMRRHGTYREREAALDEIKTLVDDRRQAMKLKNKINNQILAYKRGTDVPNPETEAFLLTVLEPVEGRLKDYSKSLEKVVKGYAKIDPLTATALGVKSVGAVTLAHCLAYIDLDKARHASSLWAYAGLDKPSHARYSKGTAGGGNKTLRTCLYTMADSQIKGRGPYREIYDRVKERLSISEKIVSSRNTQGKMVEVMWKDTKPCHRHGAAIRAVMKHFLADYWFVGRLFMGLDTSPLYAEAMLGKTHKTVSPRERGWVY